MRIKKITKSISISDASIKQLHDMADYYGHNDSAMIQIAISELHGNKYRKERFGQQKGAETIDKKKSVETLIVEFEAMTDEEATKYLYDIGYNKPDEIDEDKGYHFEVMTREEGGRGLYQVYAGGSSMSRSFDMLQLKNELRKFLKANKQINIYL